MTTIWGQMDASKASKSLEDRRSVMKDYDTMVASKVFPEVFGGSRKKAFNQLTDEDIKYAYDHWLGTQQKQKSPASEAEFYKFIDHNLDIATDAVLKNLELDDASIKSINYQTLGGYRPEYAKRR